MVKGLVGGFVILVFVTVVVVVGVLVVNFWVVELLPKGFVKGLVGLAVDGDGVVVNFTFSFSVVLVTETNGTFEVLGIFTVDGRLLANVVEVIVVGLTFVVFLGGNLVPTVVF